MKDTVLTMLSIRLLTFLMVWGIPCMGIVLCFSFLCFVYIFRFLDILILDKICLLWRNSIWGSDFLRISAPMLHTYLSEFMSHKKGDRSYTSTSTVLLCNWEYNCILHREHTVASTRYVLLSKSMTRTRTNLRWLFIHTVLHFLSTCARLLDQAASGPIT